MKNILLAIALIATLPVVAIAEENAASPAKATPKEHHMQNANPSATEAVEQVKEQAPAHTMNNANPAPKEVVEKVKQHTMQNK
ncbi:MAG: hypothetical protein HOP02_12150 [Methylococcaceae bacterium]|nr:hypothetical protein [Methylococcaceae bacterium]